jgi:hypothetical protein
VIVAWFSTAASSLYFAWMLLVLNRHTRAFKSMFEGLGADIPAPTRFVIENQGWFFPLLFGGAGLGLITKELLVKDKRLSLAITLAVATLVLFVADWIRTAYFFPLFEMVEKLQ